MVTRARERLRERGGERKRGEFSEHAGTPQIRIRTKVRIYVVDGVGWTVVWEGEGGWGGMDR